MLKVNHHNVFGAYTCIAENVHGRLEKVVMLTEGAKPGTPKLINPEKIYADGLILRIYVSCFLFIYYYYYYCIVRTGSDMISLGW